VFYEMLWYVARGANDMAHRGACCVMLSRAAGRKRIQWPTEPVEASETRGRLLGAPALLPRATGTLGPCTGVCERRPKSAAAGALLEGHLNLGTQRHRPAQDTAHRGLLSPFNDRVRLGTQTSYLKILGRS
jgi:hypothetical protein